MERDTQTKESKFWCKHAVLTVWYDCVTTCTPWRYKVVYP